MPRRTKEQWQALIKEQAQSGLPVVAFCKERGVNAKYFYLLRKRLSQPVKSAFVPVNVTSPVIVDSEIRLQLNGVSLVLPSTLSPVWLADLIRHLSS